MSLPIRQKAEDMLDKLPPEGLAELARFIEFLHYKYLLKGSRSPTRLEISEAKTQYTVDQALGLLEAERPAPSDAEIEQWLIDHRMDKFGK